VKKRTRFFPWYSATVGAVFAASVIVLMVYGWHRRDSAVEQRRRELLGDVARATSGARASSRSAAAGRADAANELATRFVPIQGARTLLVPRDGGELARERPGAWQDISRGASPVEDLTGLAVASAAKDGWLVTFVPREGLEDLLRPLRRVFDALIGIFALTSIVGALALALMVRMRLWAYRAHETEQYVIAIRREGAKWKALTESAADVILIVDPQNGAIFERNRMAQSTLGERSLGECLPAAEYDALRAAMQEAMRTPGTPVSFKDVHLGTIDGREALFHPLLAGIDLGDNQVVEISMRDVTRERAMERQLAISDRLSSLGLLHRRRRARDHNHARGIGNYLALLERPDVAADRRPRYVEQVRHGFERIRDLVRDLLTFARPGVERGEADLADVVARVCKLVRFSKSFGDVSVNVQGLERPVHVVGDPGRLEQVLLNLLINAATAMGGKGPSRSVRARCRRARAASRGRAGRRRRRARHRRGKPVAHLRPVLHHHPGHGPRAVDLLRHRARARRYHHRLESGERRRALSIELPLRRSTSMTSP
jgi:signal transduction histidine kinase